MKNTKWILMSAASCFAFTATLALADGHGQGKGKGHDKQDNQETKMKATTAATMAMAMKAEGTKNVSPKTTTGKLRAAGTVSTKAICPGLAKRNQLPPGLQRQLVMRGTLPPGLQKRVQPVPRDLEVRLAPPPPECAHV